MFSIIVEYFGAEKVVVGEEETKEDSDVDEEPNPLYVCLVCKHMIKHTTKSI